MSLVEHELDSINIDFEGQKYTLYKAQYAYHVTNILSSEVRNYDELKLTVADDKTYDGPLVGLPCVFFTVSLYYNKSKNEPPTLPTFSIYPRFGQEKTKYKRVKVRIHIKLF